MTDKLEIITEDDRWTALAMEDIAVRAVHATLTHLALDPDACEICILACNDARIAELNTEFRDKAQPTNVLSWPAAERSGQVPGQTPHPPQADPEGEIELGDIAIAYETCVAEAATAHKPISAHVTHLIVHGTLHLLGYDHITEKDAALMEGLETKILGNMGLDDPYKFH